MNDSLYSCLHHSLSLAILQKTEKCIREIVGKPIGGFYISHPREINSEIELFDYCQSLMQIIDLDPFLEDNFSGFFHSSISEARELDEECYPVHCFSFGLLIDGIRKYGEQPFEHLIKEAQELMNSLSVLNMFTMKEYLEYIFMETGFETRFYWELKNFKHEMRLTFLYHWSLHYCTIDDAIQLANELPVFAKKYVLLYKKIINVVKSLGGTSSNDFIKNSQKRAV